MRWVLFLIGSAIAQQSYENASLNSRFEAPAGWAMEKPDTNFFGVHFQVTRVGLKPVNIYFEKYDNALEAYQDRQSFLFFKMTDFYNRCASNTTAPIVPYMLDTLFNSGISYSGFTMRHVALDKHLVCYTNSFKVYIQGFCYETSISDYDTNRDLYVKNWQGASYINLSTTTTKIAAPLKSQANEKQVFIDALGRKAGAIEMRIPQTHFLAK